MKKYGYIILIVIFIAAFEGCMYRGSGISGISYAALLQSDMGAGTASAKIAAGDGNDSPVMIPPKKNTPKTQTVPQKTNVNPNTNIDALKRSGVTNIAFFGLDRRNPNEGSRSDTIMVVSIDEKLQKIKVTSLMRDMYVPIPGKGDNKINAAYAFGGSALAIKTVNQNFGLDIKDYVVVDFFGLEKLIDTLGGVKINISSAEANILNSYQDEIDLLTGTKSPKVKGGNQTLNGRQAVAYCRIRYVGHADYERTERQRRVLNEILRKIKQNGITKLPKTISTVMPYVKTSLSAGEVLKLAIKGASFKTDNIVQYRLPVDGTFKSQSIRGMAVLVPDIQENRKKLYEFIYGK